MKHKQNKKCLETLKSPETKGYRLQRARKIANLSRRDVSVKYDFQIDTYKGWELGKHGGLTIQAARKIVTMLAKEGVSCSLEWLMYGIGEGPHVIEFIYPNQHKKSTTSISTFEPLTNNDENKQIKKELVLFHKGTIDSIAVCIEDDSMLPFYHIGDHVAGSKHYDKKIKRLLGLNCIIQTANNDLLVRQLNAGRTKNLYNLTALNPLTKIKDPVLYNVELINAAPIIWTRRRKNTKS